MRVFLAVEVGDEVRRELAALGKRLKWALPHLRTVPPENLHITLRFIGEVEEPLVREIDDALRGRFLGERFVLKLGKVGGFPSRFGARVVWVGLQDDSAIRKLSDRIDALLSSATSLPERDKPFKAHITVARARRPVNVESFSVRPLEFEVRRVVLFKSTLAKPHAIYQPLDYYHLAGT
ncbi:MAG: RNA 2',3'-cyclic phosphodiesterase [Thermotogae bacterium]|nr:RNA 2',3'-cyclic phosphodiesterase [Thermotogota bacterium]